jgi:hypothetical protein
MKKRRLLAILVTIAMVLSFATLFSSASADKGEFTRTWGDVYTYRYDITLRVNFGASVTIPVGTAIKVAAGDDGIILTGDEIDEEDELGVASIRVAAPAGGGFVTFVDNTNVLEADGPGTLGNGKFRGGVAYTTLDIVLRGFFDDRDIGTYTAGDLRIADGLVISFDDGDGFDAEFVFDEKETNNSISIQAVNASMQRVQAAHNNGDDLFVVNDENVATLELESFPLWNEAPFVFGFDSAALTVSLMPHDTTATGAFRALGWHSGRNGTAANRLYVWTDLVKNSDGDWLDAEAAIEGPANNATDRAATFSVALPTIAATRNVTLNLPKELFWNENYCEETNADLDEDDPDRDREYATEIYMAILTAGTGGEASERFTIVEDTLKNVFITELNVKGDRVLRNVTPGAGSVSRNWGDAETFTYDFEVTVDFGERLIFEEDATAELTFDDLEVKMYEILVGLCEDHECEDETEGAGCDTALGVAMGAPHINFSALYTSLLAAGENVSNDFHDSCWWAMEWAMYNELFASIILFEDDAKNDKGAVFELLDARIGAGRFFGTRSAAVNHVRDEEGLVWTAKAVAGTPRAGEMLIRGVSVPTPRPEVDGYNQLVFTLRGVFAADPENGSWTADDFVIADDLVVVLDDIGAGSDQTAEFMNIRTERVEPIKITRVTAVPAPINANEALRTSTRDRMNYANDNLGIGNGVGSMGMRGWAFNEAPFVFGFEKASLELTIMPEAVFNIENETTRRRFVSSGTGTSTTVVSSANVTNPNRIYVWTDLARVDFGSTTRVMNANDLAGTGDDATLLRNSTPFVTVPTTAAPKTVTINDIPKDLIVNPNYDASLKDTKDYIPEFATRIYFAMYTRTGSGATATWTFNPNLFSSCECDGDSYAACDCRFGLYAAELTVDGFAAGNCDVCGEAIEDCICKVTYVIDDITDYLDTEYNSFYLPALLEKTGADYIKLSANALAQLAELEDNVYVVIESEITNSDDDKYIVYQIVVDSIADDADGFILNVSFSDEAEGWILGDGSIVINFVQEGEFGLDTKFWFYAEALEDFDLEELGLWYVKDGEVSLVEDAIEFVYEECEDDDCEEAEECECELALVGIFVTISSASFYVLADEAPTSEEECEEDCECAKCVAVTTPAVTTVATPATTTPVTTVVTQVTTVITVVTTAPDVCENCEDPDCDGSCEDIVTTAVTVVTTPATTTAPPPPPFDLGDVDGSGEVDIVDVLEILLYLAGLDNIIDDDETGRSLAASLITPEAKENGKPGITDVLEILLKLAGLPSAFDEA